MSARWRLAGPHYLNVEGSTWEYKEVDRTTGKQKRTLFPVPQLLDPDNPGDWNYVHAKDNGEIIVANGKNEYPNDIIFTGEPTPDMVPLNDEAKAITAKMAPKWKHPIESLSTTYADAMLKDLTEQVEDVRAKSAPASEGMTELLTAMAAMMKQNQEMMQVLAGKSVAEAKPATRRP